MKKFQYLKNPECNFLGFITSEIRNPGNEKPQFQKAPDSGIRGLKLKGPKNFRSNFLVIFGLRNPRNPFSKFME